MEHLSWHGPKPSAHGAQERVSFNDRNEFYHAGELYLSLPLFAQRAGVCEDRVKHYDSAPCPWLGGNTIDLIVRSGSRKRGLGANEPLFGPKRQAEKIAAYLDAEDEPATYLWTEAGELLGHHWKTVWRRVTQKKPYLWAPGKKAIRTARPKRATRRGRRHLGPLPIAADVEALLADRAAALADDANGKERMNRLEQAAKKLKVKVKKLGGYLRSDYPWPPAYIVLRVIPAVRPDSLGRWRPTSLLLAEEVDAIVSARSTASAESDHVRTIDGHHCLSAAYAAAYLEVVPKTIYCLPDGCVHLNGEKLQPVTDPNPPRHGWHGKLPDLFWRFHDLKRVKTNRTAAIKAGWSGRGPLPPEFLIQAGDDPSKANGKITPPPPAEANSTKSPDPTDEAMEAAYLQWPYLKRNLRWLVKDAELEAEGKKDRPSVIRDWWNALSEKERAETGISRKAGKGRGGTSVIRGGLKAARKFLSNQG